MIVRKRVHYRGNVQGVGFRATAQSIAARHPVSGYVRNLANGQVELVAEGEAEEVDRFLAAVAERMAEHIAEASERTEPPQNRPGFRIEH